ncbi:heme-degrading domain-containing protein [Burkholderia dolosa]|uniref:heme-degrading domain-containing protein n=1 Tax=Burkholderia dolosa TaxID=152500 RepID=UPI001BA01106|nr:heme-degrading domain-containing protein [Burkholderia dolosa]MBR8313896.1 heme-degrading domain-containing protein [Burkholderia dolosa]MBY4829533.1 heme-degrading domain-containing protein [Burkholderia dolosa]
MATTFLRIEHEPLDGDASEPTLPCFNADVARRLGEIAINVASRRGLPIAVCIVGRHAPLFYCALDGSDAADSDAIRRRQNTVLRFGLSSLEVGVQFRRAGWSLRSQGLSDDDYALDGGGVPLRLDGAGMVGAMTIAGLDSERNHALVVESLRWHVGAQVAALIA